jgi:hypothetical protein
MTKANRFIPERRRHSRANLILRGRYMLSDATEFPCETVDVSPVGLSMKGRTLGRLGERVVVYVEHLGRIEGEIIRRASGWFAIEIHAADRKRERMADKIDWLMKREAEVVSERRFAERIDMDYEQTVVRTSDGREFPAELVDVSIDGATVLVNSRIPVGVKVILGDQPAYVARRFAGGIAVVFEEAIPSVAA